MNPFLIALVLVMLLYFVGRIVNERALKSLEPDKKLALIDAFSSLRIYNISTVVVIMVFYFANLEFKFIDAETAHVIYILCLVALLLVTNYIVYKKLKAQDFPASYIRFYVVSNAVRFVVIVAFLIFLDRMQYQ